MDFQNKSWYFDLLLCSLLSIGQRKIRHWTKMVTKILDGKQSKLSLFPSRIAPPCFQVSGKIRTVTVLPCKEKKNKQIKSKQTNKTNKNHNKNFTKAVLNETKYESFFGSKCGAFFSVEYLLSSQNIRYTKG